MTASTDNPAQAALLSEVGRCARLYRDATDDAGRAAARQSFDDALTRLHASGWQHALGEDNEIPDPLLPADYLARRARLLGELEDDLARRAMQYRGAVAPEAMAVAASAYRETLEEMYRIGHWHGMPDPDSQLPLEEMPECYRRRRAERIARHRARQAGGTP